MACVRADWIEHVVATGGEPYLHTPEEGLPFLVRHSLDTAAAWAALAACAAALLVSVMRALAGAGAWGAPGLAKARQALAKTKAA